MTTLRLQTMIYGKSIQKNYFKTVKIVTLVITDKRQQNYHLIIKLSLNVLKQDKSADKGL